MEQQGQRNTYRNTKEKREDKTAKLIKDKLRKNKAIVAKADKGNSTVILYSDDYTQKVNDFISCDNFTTANACITKNLQIQLRDTINECKSIIQKYDKWKLMNINPTAPTMRGLIKVHKEGAPIRPVVNWRNAPGYKLVKMLVKALSSHTPLTLHIQCQKHGPTDGRPIKNPTRTSHEVCFL